MLLSRPLRIPLLRGETKGCVLTPCYTPRPDEVGAPLWERGMIEQVRKNARDYRERNATHSPLEEGMSLLVTGVCYNAVTIVTGINTPHRINRVLPETGSGQALFLEEIKKTLYEKSYLL